MDNGKQPLYNWETTFDTAENMMIHEFAGDIKLYTDLTSGIAVLFRGPEQIKKIENLQLGEYENLLLEIAKQAEPLRVFE